jgi:hypothetical protein
MWVVYKILRSFFVSVYFYFLPFFVIVLTIVIPAHYLNVHHGDYPALDSSSY